MSMGLETVIEEILERGKREAEGIRVTARAEKERMLDATRAEAAELLQEREREGQQAAERLRVQMLARAELESKKIALAAQKEVLDEVYHRVLERLRSMPDAPAILRRLFERERSEWTAGHVYSSAKDAEVVRSIVGKSFAGTIDCVGGIVVDSADGTRRLDLRFESILADVWDDAIQEVAATLWPKE